MKKLFLFLLGALLSFSIIALKGCEDGNYVSRQEFFDAHNFLNKRVDTVIVNQEQMKQDIERIMLDLNQVKANQVQMQNNIDTLKAGQQAIYYKVSQPEDPAFFTYIKNFLR